MSASTEEVALKILTALAAEQERAPTLLQCKPYEEILATVAKRHRLAITDVRNADQFLKRNRLIKGAQRQDGFAALPSSEGITFVASHQKTEKQEKDSKREGRQRWYAIIISLLGVIVALLSWRSCSE
jgi:hypothetical protein